jgi:proline iminopeptidase
MNVPVQGARLFCSTRGQGPACLVLCNIGTATYERQTPPPLSEKMNLVYVDLRGSGQSTGAIGELDFDRLAEDLEAVRAHFGLERVAVLGHSILGVLAIEYGRRCPGSVSHVIAVGTPPSGNMAQLMARSAAFFQADASEDRKRVLRENLARLGPEASPAQRVLAQTPMRFFDPTFDPAPLFAEAIVKPEVLAHLLGPLTASWDVTAGASSLRAPLMIALGRHDYVSPYTSWDEIAPTLPSATVRVFERSGHQPFFEEPEPFHAAVSAWMAATPAGAGRP